MVVSINSKSYTQSELFTLANKIRKEKGVSQKEAYQMAKYQLETPVDPKKFNLQKAMSGAEIRTRSGKRAKVICFTRGKILVQIYSNVGFYMNTQVKYNIDGSRWSSNHPDDEDLVMA